MNKIQTFLIGWFGASLLCLILIFLAPQLINIKTSCPQPTCPEPEVNLSCPSYKRPNITFNPNLNCPDKDCPEQSILKEMVENNADSHSYKLDEYDCTEHSKELARRLNDKGFDAETKFTEVNCNSDLWSHWNECEDYDGGHLVVELDNVYLEATSGDIIDPQDYKDYGLRG